MSITVVLLHLLFGRLAADFSSAKKSGTEWDEETLSLLQVRSSWKGGRDAYPSSEIDDGDTLHFKRDEPLTWPTQLQYPEFDIPIPIHIFVWSMAGFIPETHTSKFGNCTVDVATSKGFKTHLPSSPDYDISDADVVIFGLPNLVWAFPSNYILPRKKSASQMWVTTCEEPYYRAGGGKSDCRLMNDPATMQLMDVTSSYSMTSDVPALLESVYVEDLRMEPPDFSTRPHDELATVAVSDCTSHWRNSWLMDVMAEVNRTGHKVLSYGSCLHNAEEPRLEGAPSHIIGAWKDRDAARRFKLVVENTMQPWYVTEKIWNALAEGAVPVYMGPQEVKQMMPKGSFLYAQDFTTTQALVQRMLNFTPEDFKRANEWRQKPTSEWGMWETTWLTGRHTMLNRMCEKAAKQKLAGKPFKSGKTPAAHDLPCCSQDPLCCMNHTAKFF